MKTNRFIDYLIVSSEWSIEPNWGLKQLYQYLHDIELLSNGVDLDYSKKREEQRPRRLDNYAHIVLSGVMKLEDSLSTYGVRSIAKELRKAAEDPDISGIILEINSGGGESTAGFYLHNVISDIEKPVVVWGHFIGSAAYNAASAADYIFASSKAAEIGSIGTMVTLDKEYIKWYTENFEEIYADQSSKKNEAWRELLKGSKNAIKSVINKNAQIFIDTVREKRLNVDESVFDGSLFYAEDALNKGLIDGIASFNEILNFLNGKTMFSVDKLVEKISNFFGWDIGNSEELVQKLDEIGSVDNMIKLETNEVIEKLTSQVSKLQESLSDITSKFEDAVAKIDTLSNKITSLEEANAALAAEKKELEEKIVQVSGKQDNEPAMNSTFDENVGNFINSVSSIVVDGDSKY